MLSNQDTPSKTLAASDPSTTSSPKKFFRAFQSSPFKSKNKEHKHGREKAHVRAQSCDRELSPPFDSAPDNGWVNMIKPMPQGMQTPSTGASTLERNQNRHTIAISPSMSNQFQQPLNYEPRYHNNNNAVFSAPQQTRTNMDGRHSHSNLQHSIQNHLAPNAPVAPNSNFNSNQNSSYNNSYNSTYNNNSYIQPAPQNTQGYYQQQAAYSPKQHGSYSPKQGPPQGPPHGPYSPQQAAHQGPYSPGRSLQPHALSRELAPNRLPQLHPMPLRAYSNQGSFHQQPLLPHYSASSPTDSYFHQVPNVIPPNASGPSSRNSLIPENHRQAQSQSQSQPQLQTQMQPQLQSQSQSQSQPQLQLQTQKPKTEGVKKRKICHSCKEVISGQFVRALNNAYHLECFKCHYCGTQCSSKFFSLDIVDPTGAKVQVPLCEFDYFKKLDLICFSCNTALRGPYITALGNKYHLEHFKCLSCGKVFESDESYYEHGSDIFCHFHYSKLFATKCEGCHLSIVKQFVELYKGGKNQQWHPECYMVFKFWNVCFTPDAVGLPKEFPFESAALSPIDGLPPATHLFQYEQKIESLVLNCWMILLGFEETTAQCVSEMLLSASTGNLAGGLKVTGKLILYVEVLFNALELVQNMCIEHVPEKPSGLAAQALILALEISLSAEDVYSADAFHRFQHLRKEPRNISGKIMSYLAILRKSHQIAASGSLSSELLSVITGCAHYLKLLIRIGLNNALKLNVVRSDTRAFDDFLLLIHKYADIDPMDKLAGDARVSIGSRLAIPFNATDACRACMKSIEKSCVRYGDSRWHPKCFECTACHRKPGPELNVELFLYGSDDRIMCPECAKSTSTASGATGIGYTSGFTKVTDLAQLLYLLRIAILRLKAAITKELAEAKKKANLALSSSVPSPSAAPMDNINEEASGPEKDYTKTLDEITTLRTKRESQSLRSSVKRRARKSVVLEPPNGTSAMSENTANTTNTNKEYGERNRIESSGSIASYVPLPVDSDQTEFQLGKLQIREELALRLVSNSLDRTTDLLKNEKSLTLDDIPRIVAAEQAREQRPNAFKHHNLLYQKRQQLLQTHGTTHTRDAAHHQSLGSNELHSVSQNYKTKYYSELTKDEHHILRQIAIEAFVKTSSAFSKEDLVALTQTKKPTFWDKFKFGSGSDKHGSKGVHVFGVDLSEVTKRYGVDSELGVGPAQLRIPIVVDDVIRALRQKDMSVEGIFRLNGNIKNLRELTDQINGTPLKSPAFDKYLAVQLAALMKKWLRELPNPLLTFNLYELWIASRKQNDVAKSKRILHLTYCMLPRCHRNLLEVLLYFFSWVASFAEIDEESGSKMDTHNLATVLAPNILLSRASATDNGTNQSSDAHFLAIEVVNQLIEMHEELAVVPGDLWDFYEKLNIRPDQASAKEVQSKIAKTINENPAQFEGSLKAEAPPSHHNTIKRGQATVHGNEAMAQ